MNSTLDPFAFASEAAYKIIMALGNLGYEHETKAGEVNRVMFRSIGLDTSHTYVLMEVDTNRLPRGVKVPKLVHLDTLHHLTAVVRRPVKVLNTTGVTYCVAMKNREGKRPSLPQSVNLDLGGRPDGAYMVPLGIDANAPRWASLLDLLNVLVGGVPGGGKSMLINAWLTALTTAHGPDELTLTLVDPKTVELAGWAGLPHLVGPIATNADQVAGVLDDLLDDIDRRARLFTSVGARNLAGYNKVATESLPLHVVVIDELTDLAIDAGGPKSEMFKKLIRVAAKGRALGILFVMATQSPRSEIVNGNLKATMNTRIAFRCASGTDSRVILDVTDAVTISSRTPGRMVAVLGDGAEKLQAFFLDDETLAGIQAAHGTEVGDMADAPALTEDERRVARIAVYDLGGRFAIDDIYAKTGPKAEGGVSYRWLKGLAKKAERRGWISRDPSDPTQPRMVTKALRELL